MEGEQEEGQIEQRDVSIPLTTVDFRYVCTYGEK